MADLAILAGVVLVPTAVALASFVAVRRMARALGNALDGWK